MCLILILCADAALSTSFASFFYFLTLCFLSAVFVSFFAHRCVSPFFFFNDTATTEIYTLSLHDALPISSRGNPHPPPRAAARSIRRASHALHRRAALPLPGRATGSARRGRASRRPSRSPRQRDRKSTRLNSSHTVISYAVFCLKKKNSQF